MSMRIAITNSDGFLSVKATGTFSIHEAKRTFLEVLDAVDEFQAGKVLFDASDLGGEPRTMERFFYGEFAALEVGKLTVRRGGEAPKFAYVMKHPVLDPNRFGETVARNRGMLVKTFESREDAVTWL